MLLKGDKVKSVFGNIGVVHSISTNEMFAMIKFDECPDLMVVYRDGKLHQWHKKPSVWRVK